MNQKNKGQTKQGKKSGKLHGVLAVHVDDLIYGGDDLFHDQLDRLEEVYEMKKTETMKFTHCGVDVNQKETHCYLDQKSYIDKMKYLAAEATEKQVLAALGALLWVGTRTRPDILFGLSEIQRNMDEPSRSTSWSSV